MNDNPLKQTSRPLKDNITTFQPYLPGIVTHSSLLEVTMLRLYNSGKSPLQIAVMYRIPEDEVSQIIARADNFRMAAGNLGSGLERIE